jgi:hypothetical protein
MGWEGGTTPSCERIFNDPTGSTVFSFVTFKSYATYIIPCTQMEMQMQHYRLKRSDRCASRFWELSEYFHQNNTILPG